MDQLFSIFWLLGVFLIVKVRTDSPYRIPGSPYPFPTSGPNSTHTLFTFRDQDLSITQLITVQTLQGLLGRVQPTLYRLDKGNYQQVWLTDLQQYYGIAVNTTLEADFAQLLKWFKKNIHGYILYDKVGTVSVNVAMSLCAASKEGYIAVAVSDETIVKNLGFKKIADARVITMTEVLAAHKLGVDLNPSIATLQDPSKAAFLADWVVFAHSVHWFDTTKHFTTDVSKTIMAGLKPLSAVFGWGVSEGATVDQLAKIASFIHASDWAPNLSVLSSFHVPKLSQRRPTFSSTITTSPKHTVCFLMTDGDNIQWMVQGFGYPGSQWYGSPDRGKIPLGWTVAPAMAELAPSLLKRFYEQSNGTDNFVAGPSGVGYTVPDKFTNMTKLLQFAELTSRMNTKADLRIVNVIQDSGKLESVAPILQQANVDGVFMYYGDSYCGGKGSIQWVKNKPVIAGRWALWDNHQNEVGLSRLLRGLPKDPTNPQSYSLIPIHAWTHNVTSAVTTAGYLGNAAFDIVTPEEFVRRITKNVYHDCEHASTATGSYTDTCSNCEDNCGHLMNCKCNAPRKGIAVNDFFDHTKCAKNAVANCFGQLICEGSACACPKHPTGSFSSSCKDCVVACGLLTNCKCNGPDPIHVNFNYSSCPGLVVANCKGALICQGEPCV